MRKLDASTHEVPFYELRVEAKLIDASKGTLLWVGSGRQSTIDTLRDSWIAEVDEDCEVLGWASGPRSSSKTAPSAGCTSRR